jgi:outer membrane protein
MKHDHAGPEGDLDALPTSRNAALKRVVRSRGEKLAAGILSLIIGAFAPSLAFAADVPLATAAPSVPNAVSSKNDWTIDLGVGALMMPKYLGSKDYKISPIPYLGVNYKDFIVFTPIDGLRVNVVNAYGFKAGPDLNYRGGRTFSDDRRYLGGLGTIDPTLEAGGFVSYAFNPLFSVSGDIQKGILSIGGGKLKTLAPGLVEKSRGNDGVKISLGADLSAPPLFDDRLFLSAGPRLAYFDETYAQAEFGVSANESLASGYKAFTPKAGIGQAGLAVMARYRVTDHVVLVVNSEYDRLVGDAAKSPIVLGRGGSKNQFTVGSSLVYRFGS